MTQYHETGLRAMIENVDAVGNPPSHRTVGALEQELARQFAETQAKVHILTGSLKLSGRSHSEFDGKTWEGGITYGGPSAGVNDPVNYARYELARGGAHNFLASCYGEQYVIAYQEAIKKHFEEATEK